MPFCLMDTLIAMEYIRLSDCLMLGGSSFGFSFQNTVIVLMASSGNYVVIDAYTAHQGIMPLLAHACHISSHRAHYRECTATALKMYAQSKAPAPILPWAGKRRNGQVWESFCTAMIYDFFPYILILLYFIDVFCLNIDHLHFEILISHLRIPFHQISCRRTCHCLFPTIPCHSIKNIDILSSLWLIMLIHLLPQYFTYIIR